MKRSAQGSGDRLPLLITVGVFIVLLACLPLVLRLDDVVDSDRPMYHDMEQMLGLQAAYVATGAPPIEARLEGGQSVMIGEKEFTTSGGVTLVVRAVAKDSFCISATNQHGAKSERCSD